MSDITDHHFHEGGPTEEGNELCIEQAGLDCNVTIRGETRTVKNCEALKLANTMFNKPGAEHYSVEEMIGFGFEIKARLRF